MKINHNIPALRTLNQLNKANDKSSKTMLRLSSGLRINSAADDAAGLAISQKMDTQVRGLKQANRNAMDGISMIQTAEGAYNEVHSMLQRMRELTVQAANGTYDDKDKATILNEVNQLQEELLAVQERTEFNKKTLLDGSQNKIMLQVGANKDQSMELSGTDMNLDDVLTSIYGVGTETSTIDLDSLPNGATIDVGGKIIVVDSSVTPTPPSVTVPPNTLVTIKIPANASTTCDLEVNDTSTSPATITTTTINQGEKLVFRTGNVAIKFDHNGATPSLAPGTGATAILPKPNVNNKNLLDLNSNESANKALDRIDQAIETASKVRAKLGAYQNRLEHTVNNLGVSEENITASLSRIQDADMALEMANFTQQNILSQAATSMLAQANQRPQQILQLLQR
jgi:flagellin